MRLAAQGCSCTSAHMTMPGVSIQALICTVTTTSVSVWIRYGRLCVAVTSLPFTASVSTFSHIFSSQPSAAVKPGSVSCIVFSTRTDERSWPFTEHLITFHDGPILPRALPHSSDVNRAFSFDSGAVARSASFGMTWFLGAAPKNTPVSSALMVSSGVKPPLPPAGPSVIVRWISSIRACTTGASGSCFSTAVIRRRRSAFRRIQPPIQLLANFSFCTVEFVANCSHFWTRSATRRMMEYPYATLAFTTACSFPSMVSISE